MACRSWSSRAVTLGCCFCLFAGCSLGPASGVAAARRTSGPPSAVPVVAGQLIVPIRAFRAYVRARLTMLGTQLDTLLAAEQAGDLESAEADWLPAHLSWLQIGEDDKFYTAFGELGRSIDGIAAGLPGGTASPQFTGFHRIEFDLWEQHGTVAAAADTVRLQSFIAEISKVGLAKWLPGTVGGLSAWVLRCHEILEDASRDTLTGADDYGSGTGVASITADVTATREMLTLLAPAIDARSPHLVAAARHRLSYVVHVADSTLVDGRWVGIARLPILQREQLDSAVGSALETLAPISELIHVAGGAT
jgi:high-affinity iron transporter